MPMLMDGGGGGRRTSGTSGQASIAQILQRQAAPSPMQTNTYGPFAGGYGNRTPAGSAQISAPAQPPVYGGGGGGGGGASMASAPAQAPAVVPEVPKPQPMKDVDWFNQDSIFRQESGNALADLTSMLAEIMAERDANYGQLDTARDDLGKSRTRDLRGTGQDFANRGLLSSGLFAQRADQVSGDYARFSGDIDRQEGDVQRNYGNRGATVDFGALNGAAGNGLGSMEAINPILGLLGSMGLGAGQQYGQSVGQAMSQSAARSTSPLLQTRPWQ